MLGQSGAPAAAAAAALGEALAAVPRPCRAAGAAGAAGCPTGAPTPAHSAPLLPVLGAAAFPSPSSAGLARACPGDTEPRGKELFPFRHPPKQPAGHGVWLPCPWGCHATTGTATAHCLRHLPVSVPAFSEGWLSPCPASHTFLYGPGGARTTGNTSREPSTFLGFLGLCHHSPPRQNFFYNPIHLCRPFVPVAGHSPMTLSICRLTAGSLPSPCTIPHAGPFSPGTIPWLPSV